MLQQQEEHAVEAEDFEQAADLSTRLDALNARVSQLTDDLRAAEADCERTSAFIAICRLAKSPTLLSKYRGCLGPGMAGGMDHCHGAILGRFGDCPRRAQTRGNRRCYMNAVQVPCEFTLLLSRLWHGSVQQPCCSVWLTISAVPQHLP